MPSLQTTPPQHTRGKSHGLRSRDGSFLRQLRQRARPSVFVAEDGYRPQHHAAAISCQPAGCAGSEGRRLLSDWADSGDCHHEYSWWPSSQDVCCHRQLDPAPALYIVYMPRCTDRVSARDTWTSATMGHGRSVASSPHSESAS